MDGRPALRVALTLEQCWHPVPGGTAVAGLGMARALSLRDDVRPVGVAARHRHAPRPPWKPPIAVHHFVLPRVALYESWHRFRRPSVERATGAVDVIHATSLAVPPRTAPLVVTIHDLAFLHDPSHFTARGVSFARRGLELATRDADLVLCPSEATRGDCESAGIERDRLRVVPLGVDATRSDDAHVARMKQRYGLTRPYILWTGTMEPRKNIKAVLAAWRRVSASADLVLVGPIGWKEQAPDVGTSATGRVVLPGFVSSEDLRAFYAGAKAFCWPSLREGFGFPILEAMVQGTPVITAKGSSTEEVAGDAAILIDPHDHAAIADALQKLLDDDALAKKLSEAGVKRASRYPWSKTGDLLADAYRFIGGRT